MEDHMGRTILETFDVTNVAHVQHDLSKINAPSVLRGIESGSLHFITVPNRDQEFIDHSLLNPEYIATHIPNGFIVDLISNQDGGDSQQNHFVGENITNELEFQNEDQERKLTAALLQLVNKQYPVKISNEAQVIVTNKDLATIPQVNGNQKHHGIDSSFLATIDDQQALTQSLLNDGQFKLYQQPTSSAHTNPPLPPLTPIRRASKIRKNSNIATQLISGQNEFVEELQDYKDNQEILKGDIDQKPQRPLAKRNLPHKKRITKKLKTIDKTDQQQQQRSTVIYQDVPHQTVEEEIIGSQVPQFACQICFAVSESQLEFFAHLKVHYEPPSQNDDNTTCIKEVQTNLPTERHQLQQQQQQHEQYQQSHRKQNHQQKQQQQEQHEQYLQHLHAEQQQQQLQTQELQKEQILQLQLCSENHTEKQHNHHHHHQHHQQQIQIQHQQQQNQELLQHQQQIHQQTQQQQHSEQLLHQQHHHLRQHQLNQQEQMQQQHQQHEQINANVVDINFEGFSEESLGAVKSEIGSNIDNDELINQNTHDSSSIKDDLHVDEVEFSDTEDMLEGIRGVVDKVQESVDNDTNDGMDLINEKSWYSNSALNGAINFKTNSITSENRNLSQSVENFTLFFKNEMEKTVDDQAQEAIATSDLHQQIQTDASTFQDSMNSQENLEEDDDDAVITKIQKTSRTYRTQKRSGPHKSKTQSKHGDSDEMNCDDIDLDDDTDEYDSKGKRKKKVQCPKCDKLFNSVNALKYHDLSHTGERPHQCEVCGKSFFALSALKVHMRLHSGDKPYTCEICQRPFRQWGDLKYHTISIHTTEKNFQCEFCGKAFARRYSLVIHRRIHTSERNYKCEFCPKTFRASSYLQNHRKVHTGEKPYACKVCGKKFRVSGDLKRHSNIHNREKRKPNNKKSSSNNSNSNNTLPVVVSNENINVTEEQLKENLLSAEDVNQNLSSTELEDKNQLVYSDEHIEIFKTEPELDISQNCDVVQSIEDGHTDNTNGYNFKRRFLPRPSATTPAHASSSSPVAVESTSKKSNDNTTIEIKTENTVVAASPVDLGKFFQKGQGLVYFW